MDIIKKQEVNMEEEQVMPSEEELQKMVDEEMAQKFPKRTYNRAERRAFKKKHHQEIDAVYETARKLTYINLIKKFRELNEKKEQENNEATQDGNTNIQG